MNKTVRIFLGAIGGVAVGVSLLFLGIVAAVAYAWMTTTEVHVPGIIKAWFTEENGAPALNFEPNGTGMLVVIAICAVIPVLAALRSRRSVDRGGRGVGV
jgi:hypothetical protein